jgi:hypothetical protein
MEHSSGGKRGSGASNAANPISIDSISADCIFSEDIYMDDAPMPNTFDDTLSGASVAADKSLGSVRM